MYVWREACVYIENKITANDLSFMYKCGCAVGVHVRVCVGIEV